MKNKKSKIEILVELDENKIPEKIHWSASDAGIKNSETKATFLSVWDSNRKESLRIDLWTKDMPLDEMKIFFYQILTSMSSTFKRATQDEKMSQTMLDFCDYFAEKLEIKKQFYHSFILLPSSLKNIDSNKVNAIKLEPP